MAMAHFWFKTVHGYPCFCDFCTDLIRDARLCLKPFWDRGLEIRQGDRITKAEALQASQIMTSHLRQQLQPVRLEALSGRVVMDYLEGRCGALPLPRLLIDRLRYGEYEEPEDEFNRAAKQVPGALWDHEGCYVVRRTRHPYNRF